MSRFTEGMYRNAWSSPHGMVTGEPYSPVRHSWHEVHERARRIAGGLAAFGIGHGDAVGVLAGAPVEIAPKPRRASCAAAHRTRWWAAETELVLRWTHG
jgi:fatty-acyl-CoA synthase